MIICLLYSVALVVHLGRPHIKAYLVYIRSVGRLSLGGRINFEFEFELTRVQVAPVHTVKNNLASLAGQSLERERVWPARLQSC